MGMELYSDTTPKRNIFCKSCEGFTTHQLYVLTRPRCGECGTKAARADVKEAARMREVFQAWFDANSGTTITEELVKETFGERLTLVS